MRLKFPLFSKWRNNAAVRSPDGDMNAAEQRHVDEAEPASQKNPNRHRARIAAAAALAVLVLGVVPVTYSYLTASSETVVNTFAGGAISLTIDEADVDTDGNPLDDEPRVTENSYKVIPGATLYKDPTVTVLAGSEVCYVYLYVENPLDENYFTLNYSSDWIEVATTGTKTLYVYKTTVDATEEDVALTPIFTTVTVSSDLTSEQIEAMGEVQIKVQAYAIQVEGVESADSVQMAADYFETEFGFAWTDVDTAVEIDGLITEEESEEAADEESSVEESSEETEATSTEATETSAAESESDSATSEETSSDDTGSDSIASSESGVDSGVSAETDSSDGTDLDE